MDSAGAAPIVVAWLNPLNRNSSFFVTMTHSKQKRDRQWALVAYLAASVMLLEYPLPALEKELVAELLARGLVQQHLE